MVFAPLPALISPFDDQITMLPPCSVKMRLCASSRLWSVKMFTFALLQRQNALGSGANLNLATVRNDRRCIGAADQGLPPGPRIETLPPCWVWIVLERISRFPVVTRLLAPLLPPSRLLAV